MTRTPKPTHGNGLTPTATLEPQKCRTCSARLDTVDVQTDFDPATFDVNKPYETETVVFCPNGCEECV